MTEAIYKAQFTVTLAFPRGCKALHEYQVQYTFTERGTPWLQSVQRPGGCNLLGAFHRFDVEEAFLAYARLHKAYQNTQPGQAK